ncbi:NAD(P)-dependent oxidoreductase [Lacticaseibacillus zhaodongensis]|uniref:NAD(P)-dependent oxidoreductase n=1 Tax=Lacticaseibacillus zhaodongensis TaxID=2668065 RepID=UPI0012D32D90|nr:NAD(P)-dependent oxidoreductase [Lacticaseibacillus zhaodongensis]
MTKILMYSVRPDEMAAINEYAAKHNETIDTCNVNFDGDTVSKAEGYDGIVIQQRAPITDDTVYATLASYGIKQLSTRTAGLDTINIPAAHAAGLIVTNVPAYSPRSVAEHALMSIFRILRKSAIVDNRVRNNDYTWGGLQAKEIHTATIGIIGAGRIGGTLARLLKALDANVLAYDTKPRKELEDTVTYVSKEELLKRSDVVSLHVDLNPTSEGLITAKDFALMQPTAGIVNASRGPVVVTADLVAALKNKQIAAACLDTVTGENDVFQTDHSKDGIHSEPLIEELHAMPNVIITPHIAFFTNNAVANMVDFSLDDVNTVLAGKTPKNAVK